MTEEDIIRLIPVDKQASITVTSTDYTKEYHLQLRRDVVTITCTPTKKNEFPDITHVPLYNIIAVYCAKNRLEIAVLLHAKYALLRKKSIYIKRYDFSFDSGVDTVVEEWAEELKCSACIGYPKDWAAIYNPVSGNGKAHHMLHQLIAPALQVAGHSMEIFPSLHDTHILDIASTLNTDKYNGILCVGGDGLINQVINGHLTRGMTPQTSHTLPRAVLPLAIVPAGSSCSLSASLGIRDVLVSILVMIKGEARPIDLGKATYTGNDGQQTMCYVSCTSAWGFMSDVLQDSVTKRWMGSIRYAVCGAKRIFGHQRHYGASITYLRGNNGNENLISTNECTIPEKFHCETCIGDNVIQQTQPFLSVRPEPTNNRLEEKHENISPAYEQNKAYVQREGNFRLIACGVNLGKTVDTTPKTTMFPYGHMNDGTLSLLIVHPCSRIQVLRFLIGLTFSKDKHLDFPFVEYDKITEVVVERMPRDKWVCFNFDGEVTFPASMAVHLIVKPALIEVLHGTPDLALWKEMAEKRRARDSLLQIIPKQWHNWLRHIRKLGKSDASRTTSDFHV
eukprot:CFRG6696T1